MPTINRNCLRKLQELGLPMDVEVRNNQQTTIATARINNDGTMYCYTNKKTYSCPSLLRDDLLGPNLPTYTHLFLSGISLRSRGVRP